MTYTNTILGRCAVAYAERLETLNPDDDETQQCLAAVFEHLAAEIVALQLKDPQLSVHKLARRLTSEAAAVQPEPVDPPDTWESHPSLTAEERNPFMR